MKNIIEKAKDILAKIIVWGLGILLIGSFIFSIVFFLCQFLIPYPVETLISILSWLSMLAVVIFVLWVFGWAINRI